VVADGSAVRAAIEAEPMLTGLLPKLVAAHAGIVAVSAQTGDPEVRKLMADATRFDAQHDDLVRTIHGALTILAKVSKAGDEHLRLRDLLFPEGLRHINKSHSAEAGHAAAVASAMSPEVLARMKAIAIGDTRLFDLAARREWIHWANVLMATAENAQVSPGTDALLFAPLARNRAESRLALALERRPGPGAGARARARPSQVVDGMRAKDTAVLTVGRPCSGPWAERPRGGGVLNAGVHGMACRRLYAQCTAA